MVQSVSSFQQFVLAVNMLFLGLSCLLLHVCVVFGTELTFELPDNDKQCFYEELEQDVKFEIDFQVSYSDSFITSTSVYVQDAASYSFDCSLLVECGLSAFFGKEEQA